MQNKKVWTAVIGILILVAIVIFLIFREPGQSTPDDMIKAAQKEASLVKTSLGKHLLFPEGDEPDIRKITEKVADPFFTKAEVGDYLVIFYKSRIAYIYSPTKNIIVNAGVVFTNIQDEQSKKGVNVNQATGSASTTPR
ncbi:MAG: hypothetical protein RJB39_539 [Candidatus Parcubacteria bacterium]|jgi:hypothetical protein